MLATVLHGTSEYNITELLQAITITIFRRQLTT